MSNQPPNYDRQFNFENYQSLNPSSPLPANQLESELNAASTSINQTISRLNEIQNADGSLKTPEALAAETTATATSVATSVATTTAQTYLAANYDPTVATQAAASASNAAGSATDAANSKQLAEAHMTNAEAAAGVAQNAAIDSAIARSESRSHAIDANESRNEAHASAQAAAASYADVGQVYGSALSLKNWIDSQAYQFVHKREDTTSVAANMLFNEGDVSNTLIGQIFKNASFNSNSNVTYPAPNNNGYNFLNGPWWIVGNPAPENPEVIIMRDMMNCLVQTWKAFGPTVARGEIKPLENGVNGAPGPEWGQLNVPGPAFIQPIVYSMQEFNTNQLSSYAVQRAALTPKGYVDYEINRIFGLANQAQSTAEIARQENIDDKIAEYDNDRIYLRGDIVFLGGRLYWFNDYIGAGGYGPITHPAAWTETGSADLTGYATESFVTSQGYRALTNTTFGNVFINAGNQGFIYVNPNQSQGETTQGVIQAKGLLIRDASTNIPIARFENNLVQIPPEGITFSDSTVQTSAGVTLSALDGYAPLSGATFSGKVIFTPSNDASGINIGIGGTNVGTVAGDIWIPTGSSFLNYRDGSGIWRNCLANNIANTIDVSSATSPALRITQRGGAPAIVVEDSITPDTSALVVGTTGNVGIGVAANYASTSKLEVVGNVKATTLSTGTGPAFTVNGTQTHSGGSDTHELLVSVNGSTYKIGMHFVSTP
jgi:hypothetical protein